MASSTHVSATSSPLQGQLDASRPGPGAAASLPPQRRHSVWRRLRRHRPALIGLGVLTAFVLLAVFAPLVSPFEPDRTSLLDRFQPPSARPWLGADELGRDIYTRLLYGGRVSLAVGVLVAVLSVAFGASIGAASAYAGGRADELTMRLVDVLRALPLVPILIVLAQVLNVHMGIKGGFWNIVLILVAFSWTGVARIIRGIVLSLKEQDYVLAARCVGAPGWRIVLRHLLPNTMAPLIVATTLGAGAAINAETALSFLGLGLQPQMPSWGTLLFNAQTYLWNNPWIAIFPGLAIFMTLVSLNAMGDGLRDALDPRLRQG